MFPTFLSTNPPENSVSVKVSVGEVELKVLYSAVVSLKGLLSVYSKVVELLAVATNSPSKKSSSVALDFATVTLNVSLVFTPWAGIVTVAIYPSWASPATDTPLAVTVWLITSPTANAEALDRVNLRPL